MKASSTPKLVVSIALEVVSFDLARVNYAKFHESGYKVEYARIYS
jgi:hypothetical protein